MTGGAGLIGFRYGRHGGDQTWTAGSCCPPAIAEWDGQQEGQGNGYQGDDGE